MLFIALLSIIVMSSTVAKAAIEDLTLAPKALLTQVGVFRSSATTLTWETAQPGLSK